MKETLTWVPMVGATGTTNYRVLTAQFGDGYKQTAADGINNHSDSWPVSFTGTVDEIRPIKAFLNKHAGHQSFYWTPPLGEKGLYHSAEFSLTALGGDLYTLSTVLEETFEP